MYPVRHHDVFALANDAEPCLLKSPNCVAVIDAGLAWARLGEDLDLAGLLIFQRGVPSFEVLANRIPHVGQSFLLLAFHLRAHLRAESLSPSNGLRFSRRALHPNTTNGNKPLNCGTLARSAGSACWAASSR